MKQKTVLLCSFLVFLVAAFSAYSLFMRLSTSAHVFDTSGDWATYLHDQTRTGANLNETVITSTTAPSLHLAWKFTAGGSVAASPTLANGVMYIGAWDGYEYAISVATKQQLWKQFLGITVQTKHCYGHPNGIGIDSTAAVQNNVVYVGGGDGYMYALNTLDGSVVWKTLLGTPPYYNWSSPVLYNNLLYIGLGAYCDPPNVQGKVLALNLSDGSIAASVSLVPNGKTGADIWGSAAIDVNTNTVYVPTSNPGTKKLTDQPYAEAIVALDATTLAVKDHWQIPVGEQVGDSDFGTTPMLFDLNGGHYLGALNKNGIYYMLNRDNLAAGPVWERLLSGNSNKVLGDNVSPSCYVNGVIYAGSAGGNNGQIYGGTIGAYDALTGTILWSTTTPGRMVTPVTCTNGLVMDTQGKTVEVRDASTGSVLFSYKTKGNLDGASLISNGVLYTPSTDRAIYAFTL